MSLDQKTKDENLKRMVQEGCDMSYKIIEFLKEKILQDPNFENLDRNKKKQIIKNEKPEFNSFIQLHPIVFEYLYSEKIFSKKAFKKYIKHVYGTEKSKEDQEFLSNDPKNVYYYKNKQYALYYKYLIDFFFE